MEQIEYKKRFAFLLFKGEQAIFAAQKVFTPDGYTDPSFLIGISNSWPYDKDVLEEIQLLTSKVPTKEELIAKMLARAEQAVDDDFAKIYKLVLEAIGYIGKGKEGDKEKATDRLSELAAMVLDTATEKTGVV